MPSTRSKPRREPKPMHLMQWLRTPLRCPSSSLPNSNKATKAIGGIREEEQNRRRNTKLLQDLDLARSPHLERDSIGEALDLDLLSPFPQKDARNSGGVKRRIKLFKVNNGGERMGGKN